jgi:pimeloyl-ACP methyl ester carboxylesterase
MARTRPNRNWLQYSAPLLLLICTGCWRPPFPTVQQSDRGLVYMFPGVASGPWALHEAYRGFRDAGVDSEIRIHGWDRPEADLLGQLANLEANRRRARVIAERIADYRKAHPKAPIDMVGYSAGGGVALLVAEALPANVHVRNVVLVQAGVSPEWDLGSALQRIDGRLVNFYCPSDWFILGAGTAAFGTVDRRHSASAGKDGFDVAAAVPEQRQRAKLVQRPWTTEMLAAGHIGDHFSMMKYQWNREYVAPWLRAAPPQSPEVGKAARPAKSEPRP